MRVMYLATSQLTMSDAQGRRFGAQDEPLAPCRRSPGNPQADDSYW